MVAQNARCKKTFCGADAGKYHLGANREMCDRAVHRAIFTHHLGSFAHATPWPCSCAKIRGLEDAVESTIPQVRAVYDVENRVSSADMECFAEAEAKSLARDANLF